MSKKKQLFRLQSFLSIRQILQMHCRGTQRTKRRQSPPGRHPRSNMPKEAYCVSSRPLDADGEGLEVSSHRPRDTPIGTAEMTDALGADDVGWEEDSQGEGETILPKSNLAPLPLEPPFQPMLLAVISQQYAPLKNVNHR